MHDENTQLKDFTEIERLIIGGSINLVSNLLDNQIYHIENHDPEILEMLATNENAQEDYILLKNARDISVALSEVFGQTFVNLTNEEKATLAIPALKLEDFFKGVFMLVACGEEQE